MAVEGSDSICWAFQTETLPGELTDVGQQGGRQPGLEEGTHVREHQWQKD